MLPLHPRTRSEIRRQIRSEVRETATEANEYDAMMRGQGPALPSAGDSVMKSQDDVDDLLASLGF